MLIDKRINYKGGGAYQGGSGAPGSAESGKTVGSVGGPSYDSGPSISGADYERGRTEFIDKFNQDRSRDFKPTAFRKTYKPIGLDRFGSSNQLGAKGGLGGLFKALLGFIVPGASFLFNQGKQGITNIGDALGNIREDFTGYRTQEEYDNARQQRINLNRINTLENTIQRKYLDKDRSLDETELDERLAALKSQMGIVPNTAEENAQQFLDFGNDLALNTKQTIFPAPTIEPNAQGYLLPNQGITGVQFPEQTSKAEMETAFGFRPNQDIFNKQVYPQRQLYPFADY